MWLQGHTFVFAYILEREGKACVSALDYPDFAESTFANYPQQLEVIEFD